MDSARSANTRFGSAAASAEHVQAAFARQPAVHVGAVGRGAYVVTLLAQIAVEQVAQSHVIVNDEYSMVAAIWVLGHGLRMLS